MFGTNNPNELRASRHDHVTAADKLIKAARESGKDLAGVKLEEYQGHITEIKNIDAQLKRIEESAGPRRGQPRQHVWPGTTLGLRVAGSVRPPRCRSEQGPIFQRCIG